MIDYAYTGNFRKPDVVARNQNPKFRQNARSRQEDTAANKSQNTSARYQDLVRNSQVLYNESSEEQRLPRQSTEMYSSNIVNLGLASVSQISGIQNQGSQSTTETHSKASPIREKDEKFDSFSREYELKSK